MLNFLNSIVRQFSKAAPMKLFFIILALVSTHSAFGAYKLSGNEANNFFALMRLSGAVVETAGSNQSSRATNLVCLSGQKTDGTHFEICTFHSGSNRNVPANSVAEFMALVGRSGLPPRISGSTTVFKARAMECLTTDYNRPAPRTSCSFIPNNF